MISFNTTQIKKAMDEQKITQTALAKATGISQPVLSRLLKDEGEKEISHDNLTKILTVLGIHSPEQKDSINPDHSSALPYPHLLKPSNREWLENIEANGLVNIYQDRAEGFRDFYPIWCNEPNLRIVGSSIEGFRRGIGVDARSLLLPKLQNDSQIKIILTHSDFAQSRECQEGEHEGYINEQIEATTKLLYELKNNANSEDQLQWKYFKGAPTCFMIIAGDYMLLNPYLYMQPAYFNFSMIVKKTNKSIFDIYSRYELNHFTRAWDNKEFCILPNNN